MMQVIQSGLPGVLIVEPKVIGDSRGFFYEGWNRQRFEGNGIGTDFVQDNISVSGKNVLRGLHYQWPYPQAKLVQILEGEVWDVAVDIRQDSPHFGEWVGVNLSSENHRQLYIPEGFAHGFCVLSERAIFLYKVNEYYHPETDKGVLWSDPRIAVPWPVSEPILSEKDVKQRLLADIPVGELPRVL
jgi:dTDP-4-dehydrorhamnose 3,5-epimerase